MILMFSVLIWTGNPVGLNPKQIMFKLLTIVKTILVVGKVPSYLQYLPGIVWVEWTVDTGQLSSRFNHFAAGLQCLGVRGFHEIGLSKHENVSKQNNPNDVTVRMPFPKTFLDTV